MRKFLFLFLVNICLAWTNESTAAKNPFSAYSAQWDLDYFNAAAINNTNQALSQNEKDFMYTLNLVRMSPVLFAETVWKPYCLRNKSMERSLSFFNTLNPSSTYGVLRINDLLKQRADQLNAESNHRSVSEKELIPVLVNAKSLNRYASTIFDNSNSVDLLVHLMVDNGCVGKYFREMIFDNRMHAAVSIQKCNNQQFSFFFFTANQEEMNDFNKPVIKPVEKPIMICKNEFPSDPILMKFSKSGSLFEIGAASRSFIIPSDAVYVSESEIDRLRDSLNGKDISHSIKSFNFDISCISNKSKSKAKAKEDISFSCTLSTSFSIKSRESDKGFTRCYLGRTAKQGSNDGYLSFICLTVPPPHPYFPAESIGRWSGEISFDQVDNSIRYIDAASPALLVKKLLGSCKNDFEKVRAIFSWMQNNIRYDYAGLQSNKMITETQDVWRTRTGVCEGYANLFNYLCSIAGVHSEKISGQAGFDGKVRGAHAWNVVTINKKYYLIDATWGYSYFMTDPAQFFKTHYPEEKRWSLLNYIPDYATWTKSVENNFAP